MRILQPSTQVGRTEIVTEILQFCFAIRGVLSARRNYSKLHSGFNQTVQKHAMSWMPPPLPFGTNTRAAYWRKIFQIPLSEPSAPLLRQMAAERLKQLDAISQEELEQVLHNRDA